MSVVSDTEFINKCFKQKYSGNIGQYPLFDDFAKKTLCDQRATENQNSLQVFSIFHHWKCYFWLLLIDAMNGIFIVQLIQNFGFFRHSIFFYSNTSYQKIQNFFSIQKKRCVIWRHYWIFKIQLNINTKEAYITSVRQYVS